jgi:hypothetical protein
MSDRKKTDAGHPFIIFHDPCLLVSYLSLIIAGQGAVRPDRMNLDKHKMNFKSHAVA